MDKVNATTTSLQMMHESVAEGIGVDMVGTLLPPVLGEPAS
jgi:hypothetical protein